MPDADRWHAACIFADSCFLFAWRSGRRYLAEVIVESHVRSLEERVDRRVEALRAQVTRFEARVDRRLDAINASDVDRSERRRLAASEKTEHLFTLCVVLVSMTLGITIGILVATIVG